MSKKEMTLIYYYIPEDQDDSEVPNVFGVMVSKNNIRLHHLYDNFPLKGSYIFRFKVMYDNVIAWLDLPDLEAKLPTFKDRIMIKVTRISWENDRQNPYGHYKVLAKEKAVPKQKQTAEQSNFEGKTKQKSNLLDEKVGGLLDQKIEVKGDLLDEKIVQPKRDDSDLI